MYYQKRISEVMKACETSENGLSHEEIIKRHQQFGYNILDEKKKENPFMIFLKQFQDLLVIILIIAAIISGMSGQIESTIVIVSVIIVNAILGTIQTLKAEKSLDSLKKLSVPKAKVIREGTLQEVDSTELTIGDLVQIEAGDVISGDGRIIECSSLQINESALTGEVESVDKTTDVITGQVVVGDQKNMVFSSSLVTNGTGRYIVTHIGMQTEIGKIASMLNNAKERKTPLQKSLDDFSGKLSIGIFFISLIVLCLNLFLAKQSLIDSLMIAVALAVAAIPEALSSIVTIVLSMSTQKMVKENAIIKNLNSVESLGCVSVICSDKTGTLTQNKMTPQTIYFYNHLMKISELDNRHHDHSVLLKSCLLCNNAVINGEQRIGDPTELALIDLVHEYTKNDIEFKHTAVRTSELPFDSDRKLMSISSLNHIYTKGAPDVIIKRCSTILINGIKEPITKRHLDAIEKENQRQRRKAQLRQLAHTSSRLIDLNKNHYQTELQLSINNEKYDLTPFIYLQDDEINVDYRVGNEKKYVVKNITEFIDRINHQENYKYGKSLEFVHSEKNFTESALKQIDFMKKAISFRSQDIEDYNYYYEPIKRNIPIDKRLLDELYEINKENLSFGEVEPELRLHKNLLLYLYINKEEDFYVIRVSINQEMFIGNKHGYRYEMNNGKFYMERIVLDEEGNIARFLESIIENEGQLIVLEEQYHDFYKYVLLPIL